MVVPMTASRLREYLDIYHNAYRAAGHPGRGKVFLSFHMFVDPDPKRARAVAAPHVESYFHAIMRSIKDIGKELSDNYKGYEKQAEHFKAITLDSLIESGSAWVGSPAEVREQIAHFHEACGGFDYASLQVNFHLLPYAESLRSLNLFGEEVIPHFNAAVAR
jgi:alkanesulfonate monooxygenase SsuD/methylene tetrahydromethanopterin reductase-like flavin-dependent oxidoreductase (luciferase family)